VQPTENEYDHYYTTDKQEGDNGVASGAYKDEGIAGYLYTNQAPGTVPFHHYYQPCYNWHFYTTDKQEGDNAILKACFQEDGIIQ
jgi:hypothetical protein